MTPDGLDKLIQDKHHQNPKGNIENHYQAKTKVNLISYTNDFVITANKKEIEEEITALISEFLQKMGLPLSEEKQ